VRSLSGPLRPKPLLVAIHSPAQTADRVLAAWLSRTVPLLLKAAYPATQRLSAPVTSPHSQYGRRHRAVPPAWDGLTQTNNLATAINCWPGSRPAIHARCRFPTQTKAPIGLRAPTRPSTALCVRRGPTSRRRRDQESSACDAATPHAAQRQMEQHTVRLEGGKRERPMRQHVLSLNHAPHAPPTTSLVPAISL
jgi:hypothetical protein